MISASRPFIAVHFFHLWPCACFNCTPVHANSSPIACPPTSVLRWCILCMYLKRIVFCPCYLFCTKLLCLALCPPFLIIFHGNYCWIISYDGNIISYILYVCMTLATPCTCWNPLSFSDLVLCFLSFSNFTYPDLIYYVHLYISLSVSSKQSVLYFVYIQQDFAFGSDYGYAWPDAIQIKGCLSFERRGSRSLGVVY